MTYQGSELYPSFEPANRINAPNDNYITGTSNDRIIPERPEESFNLNNNNQFPVGWVILVFVLLILLAVVIFFFVRQRQQLIEPDRCPAIKGNYGVIPGFTGEPIKSCGNGSNESCISIQETLEDAINLCNLRSDICTTFSYDPASGETVILSANNPLRAANRIDVYLRQVKISQDS